MRRIVLGLVFVLGYAALSNCTPSHCRVCGRNSMKLFHAEPDSSVTILEAQGSVALYGKARVASCERLPLYFNPKLICANNHGPSLAQLSMPSGTQNKAFLHMWTKSFSVY